MLNYKDQELKKLQFKSFNHAVDASQFTVLDIFRGDFNGNPFEVGIIGESHYLNIGNEYSEVLACVDLKEEAKFEKTLFDSFSKEISNENFFVSTSVKIISYEDNPREVENIIKYFSDEHSIQFVFPSKTNIPFTAVTGVKVSRPSVKKGRLS